MESQLQAAGGSKGLYWLGWALCIAPVAMLIMSGVMKVTENPLAVTGFATLGFPSSVPVPLGYLELGITLLYVIPSSSIFGAILLTGYLGGAICTHLRVGEAFYMPFLFGILLWASLFCRDARVRALLPLVK